MFSLSSAWVNAAKPTVEVGVILSQSQRRRSPVIIQGEVRAMSRGVAHRSGLGLPLPPQDQVSVPPLAMAAVTEMVARGEPVQVVLLSPVPSPVPSPPQSDDEGDPWTC
jgi:hypothetical protein